MKSVRTKVALAVCLASLFIALFMGATSYYSSAQLLRQDAETQLLDLVTLQGNTLDFSIQKVVRLAQSLRALVTHTLRPEMMASTQHMHVYEEAIIPHFLALIDVFQNRSGWVVFNSQVVDGGHVLSYTKSEEGYTREPEYDVIKDGYANESWWKTAIEKGSVWTELYTWEPWDAVVTSYAIPIIIDGQVVGVTGGELFYEDLNTRVSSVRLFETGNILLLNESFEVLVDPNGDDTKRAYDAQITDYLRRAINSGQSSGVTYIGKGKDSRVVGWYQLTNKWLVVANPVEAEMFSRLNQNNVVLIGMTSIAITLCLLFGLILGQSMTKRLKQLANATQFVMNDAVSVDLPIENRDEIGVLARAYKRMKEEIALSIQELAKSEEKHRSLIENVHNMIFSVSPTGDFVSVNPSLEVFSGLERSKLLGQPFHQIFNEVQNQTFWRDKFNQVLEKKQAFNFNFEFVHPVFSKRVLSVTLIPILDEKDKIELIMGSATDISDLMAAQAEVNRLLVLEKQTLERTVKKTSQDLDRVMKALDRKEKISALSHLVSGVSHEINTPLGVAITAASYLESTHEALIGALGPVALSDEGIQAFLDSSREGLKLINDNLTKTAALVTRFKEIGVNEELDRCKSFALKEFLEETLALLQYELKTGQVMMTVKCPDDLYVYSYPEALKRILGNLVENSIKHAFEGVTNREIICEASVENQVLNLVYSDNGRGIPPEHLNQIFDPFFTTRRGQGGSGLGLNVVYHIVSGILNGHIEIESQANQGTVFRLTIPLSPC